LERAAEDIRVLNCFVHGQTLWIDELREQVSVLRGEPIPRSVLLSPPLGLEEEIVDAEREAEEEAEVRTLIEDLQVQEVEGSGFTPPPEENEEPVPIAESSTLSRPGIGYLPSSEHRAWILERIRGRQEANRREYEARQLRMAVESFDDPAETFDPRVDS
jgi:hypothetical protein